MSDVSAKAWLATSTGLVMEGRSCGAEGTASGEITFNTSMSGYQEIMTNPGAAGQVLVFTMPEVGIYGVNALDVTTPGVKAAAVVARAICDLPSNWTCEGSVSDYLKAEGVVAIDGLDTRMLTQHIRDEGVAGTHVTAIVTTEDLGEAALVEAAKAVSATATYIEAEALAAELGATLTRMPVGNRASNIPVKDLRTGKLCITSQHHGYAIDFDGVEGVEVTHVNLNDGTVEGFAVPSKGIEATLFASLELRELNPAVAQK
ncbi:MAG: hypothetical protein FWE46_05800 [Coriobacteriia bacterium]|nr:hypothetical protein [Coriobacteriia bacterium]